MESTYDKLVAPDPLSGEQVGQAVAVDGEEAAVVSRASGGQGGRVQVWRRVTGMWELVQVLDAPPSYDGAEFGRSLAMAHGVLAVGAPDRDVVYTYELVGPTWRAAHPVRLDDTPDADNQTRLHRGSARFGDQTGVAVGDGFLVVGARHQEAAYSFTGLVGGAWRFEQRLVSSQHTVTQVHGLTYVYRAEFGCAVAVQNDTLVVGAQYEYPPERRFGPDARSGPSFVQGTGAAFVFYRNATARPDAPWAENHIAAAPSLLPGDRCAARGAPTETPARLRRPPARPPCRFGRSVAVDGDQVVVGASSSMAVAEVSWDFESGTLRVRFRPSPGPLPPYSRPLTQGAASRPMCAGVDQDRRRVRRTAHPGGQQCGAGPLPAGHHAAAAGRAVPARGQVVGRHLRAPAGREHAAGHGAGRWAAGHPHVAALPHPGRRHDRLLPAGRRV